MRNFYCSEDHSTRNSYYGNLNQICTRNVHFLQIILVHKVVTKPRKFQMEQSMNFNELSDRINVSQVSMI